MQGTNSNFNRSFNRRIVIETVRIGGPLSRSDISRTTGLTVQGVSNIVAGLMEEGILRETGRRIASRGQPPLDLSINPAAALSIGINVDRDRIVGVLVDLGGTVLQRAEHAVDYPLPHEAIDLIEEMTQGLRATTEPHDRMLGVGLALPTGKSVDPPEFPGWSSAVVKETLADRLECPLYIDNDATVAAIGERWYGRGQAVDNFFYVYFGMALGGGVVLNGQPYHGTWGNAGEFGHLPVESKGKACPCGGRGCLERYISLTALYTHFAEHGVSIREPKGLISLYEEGNPLLIEWLDEVVDHLLPAVVAIENLFDPRKILFGGRLPLPLLEHLLRGVRRHISARRMRGRAHHPDLLSATAGVDAAALGAATLLIHEALAPSHDLVIRRETSGEGLMV